MSDHDNHCEDVMWPADAKRPCGCETRALRQRLAKVERERDTAFETWKKFHQETLAAFIKNEHEPLKLRWARAKAVLSECRHFVKALCNHDDATCGCYQHLVLRGIDALLAPDSASHRENERG